MKPSVLRRLLMAVEGGAGGGPGEARTSAKAPLSKLGSWRTCGAWELGDRPPEIAGGS